LVKAKMDTLIYYAMTSPEKLDRIGEYLEQRITRDIYRVRNELVGIGIEAMDQVDLIDKGTIYTQVYFEGLKLVG